MIEVRECSKAFGQTKAVNQATLDIGDREVFGLVGSNGAGKSTLLRMMAGIIRPDQGEILIDDMPVYENEEAKKLFFYISDDSYFPPNYTAVDMVRFYRNFYPEFRIKLFHLNTDCTCKDPSRNTFQNNLLHTAVPLKLSLFCCSEHSDAYTFHKFP